LGTGDDASFAFPFKGLKRHGMGGSHVGLRLKPGGRAFEIRILDFGRALNTRIHSPVGIQDFESKNTGFTPFLSPLILCNLVSPSKDGRAGHESFTPLKEVFGEYE
jgi:hypothetical protein